MKKMYFRTVQKSFPRSKSINIPQDIAKHLGLDIGDIVLFSTHDGIVEMRKAQI